MIATIDLISPELHQRRCRRTRLRAYAGLFVLVIAGIVLTGAHASNRAKQANELNRVAADLRAAEARLNRDGAKALAELARTQKTLHEAQRLRDGHRWSRLLNYLAAQVPDSVLLVMVATDPPEPGRGSSLTPRSRQAPKARRSSGEGPRALAIRGYALEHEDLAAFLGGLNKADVFDSVSLLHTKREPFLDGEGLAFTLTCHW